MKQKEIFLQSEGDAWFTRNRKKLSERKLPDEDFLLRDLDFLPQSERRLRILEIGCGEGTRLAWIKDNLNADCYGIEPSSQAVSVACAKGIHAQQGTADTLPFENQFFDFVIFGFCLCLCDRDDLFRIASEANRVLRSPGWLAILDFFRPMHVSNEYHHYAGVQCYKMDYRSLFNWHPDYLCVNHKLRHHSEQGYTDNPDELVAISILRKCRFDTSL